MFKLKRKETSNRNEPGYAERTNRSFQIMAEGLEQRTLLSGTVQVQVGSTLQMKEFQSSSFIAVAPHGSVVIDVNVKPNGSSQPIPTGQVLITWYDQGINFGQVTATLVPHGTGAYTSATISMDGLTEIPILNTNAGHDFINAVYLGDSNYKKTNSAATNYPSSPWTSGGSYVPVSYTDYKIVFINPPTDSGLPGVGVPFKQGVYIAEEDSSGTIVGSNYMLTLAGTLVVTDSKGQSTQLAINDPPFGQQETAYFQFIPLDIGTYHMTFYGVDGLSVTSQQFSISQYQLEFIQPPNQVAPGLPIPFTVKLEDSGENVITSDDSYFVQITASLDQDGATVPLQGTTTVKLTNGIATFGAGVNFSSSTIGYTDFTATVVDSALQPVSNAAKVTLGPLFVGGYHLAMVKQLGANINPLGPNQVIYDIEDLNNKPVSIFDHTRKFEVFADLYLRHMGVSNQVEEIPLPPPKNGGKISFNLVIDSPEGIPEYYLTTRIVANKGTAMPPIEPSGSSNPFSIVPYQAVVTGPATLSAGQPARITVQIEDVNNKPVTSLDHSMRVQLTAFDHTIGEFVSITAGPARSLKHGLVTFSVVAYSPSNEDDVHTTFTTPNGTQSDYFGPTGSTYFVVTADHFTFAKLPLAADAGVKVRGQVVLQDSANNKVPYFDGGRKIRVSVYATLEASDTPVLVASNLVLHRGVANFTYKLGSGTYTLSAQAQGINGTSPSAVDPAVSDPFTITGYHMVFLTQPKDITTKTSGRVVVAVEDINGKFTSIFDHTPALGIGAQIENATDQVFDLAQNLKLHSGRTAFRYFQSNAGMYQLGVIVNGTVPIESATSNPFTVS
jgi:hypothetical protein